MDTLINFFINSKAPTLIRHLLCWFGVMLAAHHVQADTTDWVSLITGLCMIGMALIWSHVTHTANIPEGWLPVARSLALTVAHQSIAVIAAIVHLQGGTEAMPSTSAGVIILLVNFTLSALHRPGLVVKAESAE